MSDSHSRTGIICAFAAFFLWGIFPLYFKMVNYIQPLEMLCHRIVWSVVLLLILLCFSRGFGEVRTVFGSARTLFWLFVTGVLITLNWLVY
ncbi:MAG: EamA family transporter RarD, partial [Campylobacteraceae bacterium]|nr:EamA family transporter RarD [Campylobacteraceae bacterium]